MAEHRVSVLTTLRSFEDPSTSRDPRIAAVVAGLKAAQIAPLPQAHFRAELRAQLVAVAPRIIAEGRSEAGQMVDIVPRPKPTTVRTPSAAARSTPGTSFLARLRSIPIARPLGIVASVVTVAMLLLGGAVWVSQKSLPGDTLYGLKRASENVQLSFASDDVERARKYLEFAGTRVGEAKSLVSRTSAIAGGGGVLAGGVSPNTASLVTATLASSDSDVRSAAKLLGGQAVRSGSTIALATMTDWAPGQLQRLDQLARTMPDGALRNRTTSSATLVHAALSRATTLQAKIDRACLDEAGTDELGPKPCPVRAHGQPAESTLVPAPGKTSGPTEPGRPQVPAVTSGGGTNPGPSDNATKAAGSSSSPNPLPTLPVPLLPLPSQSVTLPVGTCGLAVTLGPLGLNLGTCATPT